MKKLSSILIIAMVSFLALSKSAKADIEAVQGAVLEPWNIARTTMTTTIEEAGSLIKDFQEESAGVMGTINESTNQYNAYRKSFDNLNNLEMKLPDSFTGTMLNTTESAKNLQKERLPQYSGAGSAKAHAYASEVNMQLLREQVANLYALAFVLHVELLKEQAAQESEQNDNRSIQKAKQEKLIQVADRLNKILRLKSEIAAYDITLRVMSLKQYNEEDDDDASGENNNELSI